MNLSEYLIEEVKRDREFKANSSKNFINLNDSFKNSGKTEINTNLKYITPNYRANKITHINNDMSKYKLNKH